MANMIRLAFVAGNVTMGAILIYMALQVLAGAH